MKPDEYFIPFADAAARAHFTPPPGSWGDSRVSYGWDELTYYDRQQWIAAVRAVFHLLEVRDADTGELYA